MAPCTLTRTQRTQGWTRGAYLAYSGTLPFEVGGTSFIILIKVYGITTLAMLDIGVGVNIIMLDTMIAHPLK